MNTAIHNTGGWRRHGVEAIRLGLSRATSGSCAKCIRGMLLLVIFIATTSWVNADQKATGAEIPRRGGTLRLWFQSEWRSLDPAIAFDSATIPLARLMFSGLLDYDEQANLIPAQASEWSVSPDGKVYRFMLRPGIRFAHGREVEAEDYVFALERVLNPKTGSPGQSYYSEIQGALEFTRNETNHVSGLRTPDSRTLEIHLTQPSFTFRYVMGMVFAAAVPRELVSAQGDSFQYHLVGSGPYQLDFWRRGVGGRFKRNPHYTGPGAWVEDIVVMIGGDAALAAMMLERGEIDRVWLDPVSAVRFTRDPKLRTWLGVVDPVTTTYFFMNTEMPPFDNLRVRQAMNYGIDKKRLARFLGGLGAPTDGVVPDTMPWNNPQKPIYEFNPEKSRALLKEAGFTNGFKTTLWYEETRPLEKRAAEVIQQDLSQIGIEVTLMGISAAATGTKLRTRRQAACGLSYWYQDYPDPSNFLDVLLNGTRITDEGCNNMAFYNSALFNQLCAQAAASLNGSERSRLFQEAESVALRDAPWVPLFKERYVIAHHPRLRGTQAHPVWLWQFQQMWLSQ